MVGRTRRILGGIAATLLALVLVVPVRIGEDPRRPRGDISEVRPCQTTPVNVSFRPTYRDRDDYVVGQAIVDGIDTRRIACGGRMLRVSLTGPHGILAERTVTIPYAGRKIAVAFSRVRAAVVTGVTVATS